MRQDSEAKREQGGYGAHVTTVADVPAGQLGWERPPTCRHPRVFVFFSNRLGCAGSILVSVILSIALLLLMRACSSGGATAW
jgi:hypothetical protein